MNVMNVMNASLLKTWGASGMSVQRHDRKITWRDASPIVKRLKRLGERPVTAAAGQARLARARACHASGLVHCCRRAGAIGASEGLPRKRFSSLLPQGAGWVHPGGGGSRWSPV